MLNAELMRSDEKRDRAAYILQYLARDFRECSMVTKDSELIERADEYFTESVRRRITPTVEGLCLYCGHGKAAWTNWCTGKTELEHDVPGVSTNQIAQKAKTFFNVGLCVRAWPEYRHAWEYFKSGKAGKMKTATFKRISPSVDGNAWQNWFMDGARSGGALLDLHVHDIDEVNYFFGKPKRLSAVGATSVVSKGGVDHVVATYDYGNGTLVMAEGGWAAAKGTPFEMSFTIVCEKATLKLDASGYHIYPVKGKPIAPKCDVKAGPTGWHQELAYFVQCVKKGIKPTKYQTLDSVATTMEMAFAEERAVQTGKMVTL